MKKLISLVAILALLTGCKSSSKATGPTGNYDSSINAGWDAFQVSEWATALSNFSTATQLNPGASEGWIGLGWTEARAPSHNWQAAVEDLDRALVISRYSTDARAGLAFAYYGASRFSSPDSANSDSAATFVIDRSSIWTFQHDETITLQDLKVLRASCRFNVGNFSAALTALQEVDPEFNADITTTTGRAELAEQIGRWLVR